MPGILPDAARALDALVPADRTGIVSTFREPCRVEGKKTMAFELEEEIEPDWIVFPTGGGTGIVAFWKAYRELEALGLLRRPMPRLAVGSGGRLRAARQGLAEGAERADPWKDPVTIASGIRVPSSRADALILQALRESGGTARSVTDEEIMAAVREISLSRRDLRLAGGRRDVGGTQTPRAGGNSEPLLAHRYRQYGGRGSIPFPARSDER